MKPKTKLVTLNTVPLDLYNWIKVQAVAERRSVSAQIVHALEQIKSSTDRLEECWRQRHASKNDYERHTTKPSSD